MLELGQTDMKELRCLSHYQIVNGRKTGVRDLVLVKVPHERKGFAERDDAMLG